jgi:hypothetical protein
MSGQLAAAQAATKGNGDRQESDALAQLRKSSLVSGSLQGSLSGGQSPLATANDLNRRKRSDEIRTLGGRAISYCPLRISHAAQRVKSMLAVTHALPSSASSPAIRMQLRSDGEASHFPPESSDATGQNVLTSRWVSAFDANGRPCLTCRWAEAENGG